MKKIPKLICLLVLLCLVITGCVITPNPTTGDNSKPSIPIIANPTNPSETEPPTVIQCQYLPEEIENPDNHPKMNPP